MRPHDPAPHKPSPLDVQEADAALEVEIETETAAKHRAVIARAVDRDRRSNTRSGRRVMEAHAAACAAAVAGWLKRARSKRAAACGAAATLLDGMDARVVAVLALRAVVDRLSRPVTLASMANAVAVVLEEEARYRALRAAARGKGSLWRDLSKRLRRTRRAHDRRAVVATTAQNLMAPLPSWDRRERMRLGVALVELVRTSTGLVEVANERRPGRRRTSVVRATDAVYAWLNSADAAGELARPLWLPMRTPPAPWASAWGGGYRLGRVAQRPLLNTRSRAAVDAFDAARPEVHLRAVNALQATEWRVNQGVLAVARALWDRDAGIPGFCEIGYRDSCRLDLQGLTGDARRAAIRARADAVRAVRASRSHRIRHARTLWAAGRYEQAGRDGRPGFYYPMSCDFRGRVYPRPHVLQIQGDDLQRGLLEFARGKPIKDREAMDAYMSRGAALFGYKRSSLRDRVEWARANTPALLAVAADPFANRGWLDQDAPWQALGWALDFAGQVREPGRHVSRLPVMVDHSSSGLQLYALLARDQGLAEATNVAPLDAPADLYQVVADDVSALLMQETDPMAAQWLQFYGGRVPRDAVKRASMTRTYGSTDHAVANFTRDAYEEERIRKGSTPFQELEGGGYKATYYLSQVVLRAMEKRTGAGHATQQWLYAMSDAVTAAGRPLQWTSPSGFPVVQAVHRRQRARIRTAVGDVVRFLTLAEDLPELSSKGQRNGFAPNWIHSLDAALMAQSVIRAQERGVRSLGTIHDCYAALAADVPVVKRTVRECAAEIFSKDLLQVLRDELVARNPGVELSPVPELGDFDINSVRKSTYFLL